MQKDKGDRVKEIVEKMQKRTPQKSKNPSLIQKEIKKELKKDVVVKEKKEEKKDDKKAKVTAIAKKIVASLDKKAENEKELKDAVDFFEDMLKGEYDFSYTDEDRGSLEDAQKVLKDILNS